MTKNDKQVATINHDQQLAERATAEVRAQIEAEDLAVPRMYVGQPGSAQVQENRVPAGSIFLAIDAEDPNPEGLYKQGGEGVRVHFLTFSKVWVYTDADGSFRVTEDRPDDDLEPTRGYQMLFCLPEWDPEMPVSMLFKVTGLQAARRILTEIARANAAPWALAFALSTMPRKNDKGRWHQPVVTPTPAKDEHVAAAAKLAALIGVGRETAVLDDDTPQY